MRVLRAAYSLNQVLTHAARAKGFGQSNAAYKVDGLDARLEFNLLNQYIFVRARGSKFGRSPRLCSVPPGRAQREPQGYAGLTRI